MPESAADLPSAPQEPPRVGLGLVLALIVGQIGLHASMAGLRMAAPLQALREGYSAWAVGLLLALFAFAPVVMALRSGRLADRHGYHLPVRLSVGVALLGMLLALASTRLQGWTHFALLCLAGMCLGTAANMGVLAIQRTAGLLAESPAHRVRLFSWIGVAPSLSNVVGPVAVGFMIDAAGFPAAYAMLLLLPLLSWFAARQVPHVAPPGDAAPVDQGTAWELLKAPGVKRLFAINLLLATCWDVHTFAVPLLGHERGFSASTIGLVLGSFTLSVSIVRMLLPLVAHHLHEMRVVGLAMLGTAVVFALYPFAAQPGSMLICAVLLGVALGAVQPMIMSTLHHLTPEHRHGEALALRSMAMNVASTVMPMVFGASGAWIGAGALFWLVGVAVGGGSWLTRALHPARETQP